VHSLIVPIASLAQGTYTGDSFEVEACPAGSYGASEWAEHRASMEREWQRRGRSKAAGLLPSHRHNQSQGEGDPVTEPSQES
jgi:hypothetical protein